MNTTSHSARLPASAGPKLKGLLADLVVKHKTRTKAAAALKLSIGAVDNLLAGRSNGSMATAVAITRAAGVPLYTVLGNPKAPPPEARSEPTFSPAASERILRAVPSPPKSSVVAVRVEAEVSRAVRPPPPMPGAAPILDAYQAKADALRVRRERVAHLVGALEKGTLTPAERAEFAQAFRAVERENLGLRDLLFVQMFEPLRAAR